MSLASSFDSDDLEEMEATFKWYNPKKGYGFIHTDKGGIDLFFFGSVLHTAGVSFLKPGVRVLAKVVTTERGREAPSFTILRKDNNSLNEMSEKQR